jgi:D-hydroxyproline dehydrogenase subunit beta
MDRRADVAIVGAGIAGLAHALAAARRGYDVVVFERDARAVGASIRNFGLVWPIGQRPDHYETALRSREVWLEIAHQSGMWLLESGSLSVARYPEEIAVMEEFLALHLAARDKGCQILEPREVTRRSPSVRSAGLLGGMWSPTELTVDPRRAIPAITAYLRSRYAVRFEFDTPVTGIDLPRVRTARGEWHVEQVVVCSGADLNTLYPQAHAASGMQQCKLQMMRTVPQPGNWQLGPALCGGLGLLHYAGYADTPSLPALRERLSHAYPLQLGSGVHALVSQTSQGELSIGDSHEYAVGHDPFIREELNELMLGYLADFVDLPTTEIAERWHGVYASSADDRVLTRESPAPGVTIVNGFGGAGMTLSFGVAEGTFAELGQKA